MSVHDITTVTTVDGLKNAIKAKYITIIIEGESAQKITSSLRKNNTGNTVSNLLILVTPFFPPAFFAGLAGKLFTHEMKKYEIVDLEDDCVTIKRTKK